MSVTVVLDLFDWLLVPTSTPITVDDTYFAEWYTILRYASGEMSTLCDALLDMIITDELGICFSELCVIRT